MFIDFLLERFRASASSDAIVFEDRVYPYAFLLARVTAWTERIAKEGIPRGSVTAVEADFSPNAVSLLLALIEHACVVVPLTSSVEAKKPEFMETAEVEATFRVSASDEVEVSRFERHASHPHYATLRERGHPGLVLFSSGSTGKAKAAVHDLTGLLDKFKVERQVLRSISFLLYDHIGGINTLLYVLSNTGCLVTVQDRSPEAVLSAIAKHRVELLPTSPTFLNLVLLSEAWKQHDLSSLSLVTYGTEPMPESTLQRFHAIFPNVTLQQTYGLSELGILRSKSRSSDSLWVKVGGEGFETRVVEGLLEVRARSAMLGYLNAPSPFTDDGWFMTGDAVEQDGEWLRILGRRSELINVGGEKVYPAEVESVIQEVANVRDVTVQGEKHPITGQIVTATITCTTPEPVRDLTIRVKKHCIARLASFKVPVKIQVVEHDLFSARFKRMRGPAR